MKLKTGFTLLEVLVAMLILVIAVAGIFGIFTFTKRSTNIPGSQFTAMNLARQYAEELRVAVDNDYYSSSPAPSGPLYGEPATPGQYEFIDNFIIDNVNYSRWKLVSNYDLDGDPTNGEEGREVKIKVNWIEPNAQ